MPKAETKKTKWVRKYSRHFWTLILIVLAFVVLSTMTDNDSRASVRFGSRTLDVEVVNNQESRVRGLGGRQSLPENEGMLFVFDEPEKHCIWMKGMNFPIDIVWVDERKTVKKVMQDVKPETYPDSFCPDQDILYVLEVGAGYSARHDLKEGTQLKF